RELGADWFGGYAVITLEVAKTVTDLVSNASAVSIHSAALTRDGSVPIHGSITLDEAAERARFIFPAAIAPGEWKLTLRFTGTLNDRLHGFYRSTYKDTAAATPTIAATQFAATRARPG